MITYETFMKQAEKITKNAPEIRNILSGVKHMENGDLVCTDSHRLYVAKGIHQRKDGAVLTPKGKIVEGNYPDVSRLIPDPSYAKQTLEIELNELYLAAGMIAAVGGVAEKSMVEGTKVPLKPPAMEFKDYMVRYHNFAVHISYSLHPVKFEESISANAIYVLDALKLLKAAGCKTVTLNFYGAMRPFTFTNEDDSLVALILPIRTY